MKKLFQFFRNNVLILLTIFLLAFIPLYPKLPLLDIRHTWVYVRVEDFVVFFTLFIWGLLLIRKKVTLSTPISVPILLFWFIGAVSTIHGIFLIFPSLMDAYPNVAFLSFLRRIEYMSLFFVGYEAMKDKRFLKLIVGVLTLTILGFVVMVMTVSRISLFALLISLGIVLYIQRKKLVIVSIPVIALAIFIFISFSPSIVGRFGSTLKEIEVLVDAKTGDAVGHIKVVPKIYVKNKVVKQQFAKNIADVKEHASPSASLVVPYELLQENMVLLAEPNAPTGENLPQGTGYINLSLSPVSRRLGSFYYEPVIKVATSSAEVF